MTQFPHDEFDDVPPYTADEVGKHRAPGAGASGGAGGGGLKWIALLAVFALVVGAGAWVFSQFAGDDDQEPTAGEEAAEEQEPDDGAEGEGEDAEGENGTEDEAEGENGEDGDPEDVDTDFPIIVYNYDGTDGVAGSVRETLTGSGFNVVDQDNWTQGWNTCGEDAPVVVHPPAQEAVAEQIAETIGASTCSSEGWTESGVIAVAVGAESLP